MSARALCESVQKIARTRESAMRHDRVERVAPLGGLLWIGVFDGGTHLGERDDGVHVRTRAVGRRNRKRSRPGDRVVIFNEFQQLFSRGWRCDLARLKRTCAS